MEEMAKPSRTPTSPFWAFLPCFTASPRPLSDRRNGNPLCATTSPVPNSKQLSMSPRLRCCLPPEMRDAASAGRHPRPKTSSKTNQPLLAMFRSPSPAPICHMASMRCMVVLSGVRSDALRPTASSFHSTHWSPPSSVVGLEVGGRRDTKAPGRSSGRLIFG